MIKLFRHIRQQLLTENKFTKYMLYAIGEIVLVVIGILFALQINNWNTQRLNNDRNQDLLSKLSTELDLNIERAVHLDSIFGGSFTNRALYTDSICKLLDSNSMASHLDYMVKYPFFYVNTFNLNTSVFEELKNTGSLYAVGSDSLVTEIQRYYQLCDRESFYNLNYSEGVLALSRNCSDGWFDLKYVYRNTPEKVMEHHLWVNDPRSRQYIQFRQYVSAARGHCRLMSRKLKGIVKESEKLKELINTEIKPLEQD